MSSSLDGFSLHVTITIAPENVKPFLEALKPCFDAVAAEKECTFIEIFQDQERPGVFRYVENWSKPKEWVMEHQLTKPYYKPYMEATEPMFIEPRKVEIFQRLPRFEFVKAKEENFKD